MLCRYDEWVGTVILNTERDILVVYYYLGRSDKSPAVGRSLSYYVRTLTDSISHLYAQWILYSYLCVYVCVCVCVCVYRKRPTYYYYYYCYYYYCYFT